METVGLGGPLVRGSLSLGEGLDWLLDDKDTGVKRTIFSKWHRMICEKRCMRVAVGRMFANQDARISKNIIREWRQLAVKEISLRRKSWIFERRDQIRAIQHVFSRWTDFTSGRRSLRCSWSRMICNRTNRETRSVFKEWQIAVLSKKLAAARELTLPNAMGASKPPVKGSETVTTTTARSLVKTKECTKPLLIPIKSGPSESRFSRNFSTFYNLKKWDSGLCLLRVAAWVATIALGFIPIIAMYITCKAQDCLENKPKQ